MVRAPLVRQAARALIVAALAAVAIACRTTPDTAIRLEVYPGDVSTQDIALIRVRTFNSADPAERTIEQRDFRRSVDLLVPLEMSIVPRNLAMPTSTLGIDVDALTAASSTPLRARVLTGFRRGEILVVRVTLSAACVDMTSCAPSETCDNGACVSARRDPDLLPRWGVDAAAPQDMGVDAVTPDTPTPPVDTPPPPPDMGAPLVNCTMPPEVVGFRCPSDLMCVPPMPPAGSVLCCRVMPGVRTCGAMTCPAGIPCRIDPMGNAICCVNATN